MPLMLRKARMIIPALCGVIPGSDRDLIESPLTAAEEGVCEWIRAILPRAEKQIMRHGLAWDRDRFEAWQRHYADPQNVDHPRYPERLPDGKDHPMAGKAWSAHVGTWYECIDCKERAGKSVIRVSFMSGCGIMVGERREFISTHFDPLKWSKGQQGTDVDVKRVITIYTGWICPACERARAGDKWKEQRAQREAAKQQEAERLGNLLGEIEPQPELQEQDA